MPLVQDRSFDRLTSSPSRYHCATDASLLYYKQHMLAECVTIDYSLIAYDFPVFSRHCITFICNCGGNRGTLVAKRNADQQAHRSCTWGMFHTKVHLISPGCPRPSIALLQNCCLEHHSSFRFILYLLA